MITSISAKKHPAVAVGSVAADAVATSLGEQRDTQ